MSVTHGSSPSRSVEPKVRVLIVDDSAFNRQAIASIFDKDPEVEVVGRAANGNEALRLVFELAPDLVTLDLEMPEMDGFSFLRLLMSRRPTPVIVISSHAGRHSVFRALELGALDFVPKPADSRGLRSIGADLLEKVQMVRRLRGLRGPVAASTEPGLPSGDLPGAGGRSEGAHKAVSAVPARVVVGIAASTGGPPTLGTLLAALPGALEGAIVIAQHMPPRFTLAFAQRLDQRIALRVKEAEAGELLLCGVVYVAPGAHHVEVVVDEAEGVARLAVVPAAEATVLAPCADRLFESIARGFGPRACAVVLTGMGADGCEGARSVAASGGLVLAEDPDSAVMPGMPAAAIATGIVARVLSISGLSSAMARFVASHPARSGREGETQDGAESSGPHT